MRKKIHQAIKDSVADAIFNKNILLNLALKLECSSIAGFKTVENIESIYSYIYANDQDEILDFLITLHINMQLGNITDTELSQLYINSNGVINSTSLDKELRKLLSSDKSQFIADIKKDMIQILLYILRINLTIFKTYILEKGN